MLKEKVQALAKSHAAAPAAQARRARRVRRLPSSPSATPSDVPLTDALRRTCASELDLDVPLDAFRPDSAPPHLHMNFRVVDEHGRQLGMGRNLAELKRALGEKTEAILQEEAPVDEGERYTGWTMGELPELMEIRRGGQTLVGYPALVDADDAVTLQVFDSPGEGARDASRRACCGCSASLFATASATSSAPWPRTSCSVPSRSDVVAAALRAHVPRRRAADDARRISRGASTRAAAASR